MNKKRFYQICCTGLLCLCPLFLAGACSDDDDDDRKDANNGEVAVGDYEGSVTVSQTDNPFTLTDRIEARVRNGEILLRNLPVKNWIKFLGNSPAMAENIARQIGAFNYVIPFQKARYSNLLEIKPQPLTLSLEQGTVRVSISVPEPATYLAQEERLRFVLMADSITVNGTNTGIPPTEFLFRIEE